MDPVDAAILGFMTFNALISVGWAWGSLAVARREPLWQWPVPWRWCVFFWMATKAALFVTLDVALAFGLSEWVALGVVVAFTYSHTWAFWRWRQLPESPRGGERRSAR